MSVLPTPPQVSSVGTKQPAQIPPQGPGRRGHRPLPEGGVGHRLLLTVEEAADRLSVGRTYMFELIRSGSVDSVRVGRLRRVRPKDLERYVAALRSAGDGPAPTVSIASSRSR